MGRIGRKAGWAAVWIAVLAVGLRVGFDLYMAIPAPPPLPHGMEMVKDGPDFRDTRYLFARLVALAAPTAVLLAFIRSWRADARERMPRRRRFIRA